jgi:histidinol-phosphate aminotransferase
MIATIEAHRPKLVCIPNPDSPTGTVLTTEELQQILSACETVGSVLLLDEAYHPFYKPLAVSCTVSSPNLVVARTFAKAWGAAGLRIGYAVAHPETAAFLHKIRPMYEVSTLAVEFMTRMLDHEADMLAAVDRLNNGKAWFIAQMRGLGYRTLPTEANYVHVDFGAARRAVQRALSGKVLYRASFDHPCLAGFSRFTVGPQGTMERVVELIRGV